MPAIRNKKASCATCPYWLPPTANGTDYGECHRRSNGWHPTLSWQWCGEHPDFLLEENNP